MKLVGALFLNLLVLLYGMPLAVFAQESPQTFGLPDGTVGEAYRVNIEAMLREKYRLKLETNARTSIFRWALAEGEMPPGLIVRSNGTIIGSPRVSRAEPYRFQLKVVDISSPRGEALMLNFGLAISAPRIRLAHINVPRLVLTDGSTLESKKQTTEPITDRSAGNALARENVVESTGNPATTSESRRRAAGSVYDSMLRRNIDAEPPLIAAAATATPCDPDTALGSLPSGNKVFTIDARNGTATGKRQFERGDTVSVVVDNKNPYLFTYAITMDEKTVEENALPIFLPLLGGLAGGPDIPVASSDNTAALTALSHDIEKKAKNLVSIESASKCDSPALGLLIAELNSEAKDVIAQKNRIDAQIDVLKQLNNARKTKYKVIQDVLLDSQSGGGQLFCKSKELLAIPDEGASPTKIKEQFDAIDDVRTLAKAIKLRAEIIKKDFSECVTTNLDEIRYAAEGLISLANAAEKTLNDLKSDTDKMDKFKKRVDEVARDTSNFRKILEAGPYDRTTEVSIGVTRTVIAPAEGTQAKAEDLTKPDKTKLKFGHAPFFSISGGIAFSPLRKLEFDRVQGFERDQQGNLVLVNGKPNLTTVIGRKEASGTRITPLLLLNGRIHDKWGPIDGVHISLGITAKNDNKGTDVEYLVGPSFSFLEDNMFLTVGGYAGRQQKLGGGLFEGFAVPSTVSDLPIEKNYRWNFGFALSYRLPVNKK